MSMMLFRVWGNMAMMLLIRASGKMSMGLLGLSGVISIMLFRVCDNMSMMLFRVWGKMSMMLLGFGVHHDDVFFGCGIKCR